MLKAECEDVLDAGVLKCRNPAAAHRLVPLKAEDSIGEGKND